MKQDDWFKISIEFIVVWVVDVVDDDDVGEVELFVFELFNSLKRLLVFIGLKLVAVVDILLL